MYNFLGGFELIDYLELISIADEAREFSYAPYSKFTVGAALLTNSNNIYKGCNIESSAYSMCNCAERTAFFKAVSEGFTSFRAIAIVGGNLGEEIQEFCPPCGACRQVMQEFCDPKSFEIVLSNSKSEYKTFKLEELLPFGFKLNI